MRHPSEILKDRSDLDSIAARWNSLTYPPQGRQIILSNVTETICLIRALHCYMESALAVSLDAAENADAIAKKLMDDLRVMVGATLK